MLDKVFQFFKWAKGVYEGSEALKAIYTVFTVVTAVVGVKGFLQARQMMAKGQDIMANKTAAGGKIPVIYGTRRVGCQVVYMDTAQNRSKDLFVVYALSVGECSEIVPSSIEIDGNSILDGNIYKGGGYVGSDRNGQTGFSHHQPLNTASQVGDVQYSNAGTLGTNPALRYSFVFNLHHGASSQTADPMLRASIPTEWTTNHKLNGICYIAAAFDYDKKGMYKGVPQITVQVKGKKVYDPRESDHTFGDPSTYEWSSNPALCFLDYITNDEYGKGLAESQINMTAIGTAADKCNTKVDQPYYNGSYQDVTWSGDSGDDFIVIDDNADWWQNKVDEFIDIRDVNDTSIFSDDITIKGSTRYEFYDDTQENRLYIDGTLSSTYTNEAGSAKAQVKRFHCNGYIDTNKNVMDNAKELLANMRGILNYVNGKYELQIEDTGTSTFSITDDHIIADAGISVDYGNKDKKANKVVIEFFNANKKYELDTATVLHDASPEYYSDDGEVLEIKAEFPYVTDPYIAYNMGKAILTRSRNQTTMQFLGTPEMYKLNVGDIVDLTYSGLGFLNKPCRVEALELQANGLVSVSLIEYFDVYTWEVPAQESVEILAKIPTIGAIHPPEANSIVFTDTDDSPINRPTLTWAEPTDFPVRQYRVDVEDTANPPVQVFSKLVDTNSVDLSFLPVGNYNANITSFNGVGIESNAVVKSFTIGNPPTATADIQNDAVVTDKITDDAITTPKILDDAVTDAKINSLTANKITAGTIDASVITVTNLDADNITSGSIGADKITVDDLSAINSDLGDIDAGSLNIGSGAFVVTTAGAMTATSADVVGNLKTGNLVVTGDAGIHGEVRATSITAETVTVESIKQEVWNEIDRRTAPAQNGFYDDFSSTGTDGYYVGVAKNFDLLGTNDNGYQINSNDIDLRAGMVTGFATSTNYTGTALEATFQYFYKLASGSTWTALTPSYVGTTDKYTTPDGYFYELDADPSHRINSGTLTAESYYHFRLTVTPTVTNNVWTDSDAGSGYKVEYGVQQSSTGTGAGTGTVTSVSGGDGITASPSSITTTGSLAVDSTVVRTSGTQTIAGDKTFSDNIVIQGDLDVQGTTTTIDTTNLDVADKNITLNYGTGDTSANANGAGITIQDAVSATQDATLTWNTANDSFNFSHPLNVTGNISSSSTVTAASFSASSSGYGTIELGGVSGAYIDLKRPNTDDFDLRLITTGTGGQINAPTGATIGLQINASDILSVSSTGIDVTGTVTFDGGTTSADLSFADSIKAKFGAGNDLQIFHNGTKSVIQNSTGNLEINNLADDSDILFKSDNGSGGTTTYFMLDGGLGYSRAIKNIRFDDNVKATFGSSNDLQISHNGSASLISDTGTGDLFIRASNALRLQSADNKNYLVANANGSLNLYYDNEEKLATSSTGIDVTGTVTADGLDLGTTTDAATVSTTASDYQLQLGAAQSTTGDIGRNISFGASGVTTAAINSIDGGTSNAQSLGFYTGNSSSLSERLRITSGGDISFYEDTGTTAKFFWDASTERLGIGTTSPSFKTDLNVSSTSANDTQVALRIKSTTTANMTDGFGVTQLFSVQDSSSSNFNIAQLRVVRDGADDSGAFVFAPYATGTAYERMRITSAGRVGINTNNPSQPLHVDASGGGVVRVTRLGNSASAYGQLEHDGTNTTLTSSAQLIFNSGGSEAMRLDSSQNATFAGTISSGDIEIGTSASYTPVSALAINEAVNTPAIEIIPTTDENSSNTASIRLWGTKFGTANRYSEIKNITDGSTANNELVFDTNGNEALRLDSSQNATFAGTISSGDITATKQITADTIYFPLTVAGIDVGNTVNQSTSSGIGIQFKLAGNSSEGDSLIGASIVARREESSDSNSSTGLSFNVSQNNTTLNESLRLDHDMNATFAGTISSGAITSTGDIQSDKFKGNTYSGSSFLDFDDDNGVGANTNTTTLASIGNMNFIVDTNANGGTDKFYWLKDNTAPNSATQLMDLDKNANLVLRNGTVTGQSGGFFGGDLEVYNSSDLIIGSGGTFKFGSTVIVDASRNLTNIGTISSGAIASSASITASGNSNNFGNTTIAALSATSGTFSASITASGNSNSFGNSSFGTISGGAITATSGNAGATSYAVITDNNGASGTTVAGFGFANGGALKSSITAAVYGNDYMTFNVGGSGTTERLRITSAGSVLVGTTDSSPYNNNANTSADNGIALGNAGNAYIARYNFAPLDLNRTGSDGDIIAFRKSGSIVGAIGAISSDIAIYSTTASHNGLRMALGAILPTNNAGSVTNNVADLGSSLYKFKDLHLSGTISSGAISTTEKLTITNANFNNHIAFVRGSSTMGLTPSGNELLVVGGGFAPNDSGTRNLGRSDKFWANVYANTYKIGSTTVIDSSRNFTNLNSITLTGSLGTWSVDNQGAIMNFSRNTANYIKAGSSSGYLVFQTGGSNTALTLDGSQNATFAGRITSGANGGIIREIGGDITLVQGAIGLRINDAASAISPTTASANNDAAVDLGVSNIRFRNLYLSGTGTFDTQVLLPPQGTANSTTTAYESATLVLQGSGWDTNGSVARTGSWTIKNVPTASVYPDFDLNFYEEGNELKFQLHGRGTGGHVDPLSATFHGNVNINADSSGSSNAGAGDLTVAGAISSGAITCGGIHTSAGLTFGQPDHFLGDEGGQNDSETLLLRNGASASGNSGIKILAGYNDGGDTSGKIQLYTNGSTSSPKLEIDIDGNIKMGSTQIISGGSRNLTNIGTISSGKIGVGANTASYWSQANSLVLDDSGNTGLTIKSSTAGNGRLVFTDTASSTAGLNDGGQIHYSHSDDSLNLRTAGANALTLDSSQNATFNGAITANHSKSSTANPILELKNTSTTNEGRYLQFTKNTGSFVGQIGTVDQTESNLFISTFDTGLKFESYITYKAILPCGTDGADVDNIIDLGSSSVRFDDIYATNGTIQTSDRNEKQDIQALTEAEQRVATACKGLIRRFRWQDSVAEKDDNPDSDETARYHFGVIAQDLQDAFTAEGLDAGDYGMFISSTWTDDDGNEKTRLGVRYNELLAFIISTL